MLERPNPHSLETPASRLEAADASPSSASSTRAGGFALALPQAHFLDHVRVLYKRRWTACMVLVVVMLTFTVYALTVTPIYEGTARLLIEGEKQNVVSFKAVIEDEGQPTDTYYQTQFKLLESRTLAAKTLDKLGLWGNEEFRIPALSSAFQRVLSALGTVLRRSSSQTDLRKAGETLQQSQVLDAYFDRLTVSPIKNSRLVDVRFKSTSAELAAKVANAHAKGYIEQNLEVKFLASKQASDWLVERLAEQRQKVEESESAVQRYRELNDAVALEDRQNIVIQKLADINAAVTKAKTERYEKEALYRQLQAIGRDQTALDTVPAIISNTFIQQLKTQLADLQRQRAQLSESLGERHPDIIRATTAIQTAQVKLQEEIAKVVQSVQNAYLAAEAQERSLVQALDAQKQEALSMNRKGIEGNVLKRDAESNRLLYEGLLQRAKETGVSGELKTSNIRLVDLAEIPLLPINPSPKKPMGFLAAFVCATVLAGMLAFFFEYLDDRIKTPDEITTQLGLPTLGLVPFVAPELLGPHPLISNGVPFNFAEAFRTVRTGVLFSVADPVDTRARTILVTSTAPGEGKTMSACNLAVGIASARQRVLLIDGDLRRPRVHKLFGIEQEPGLSNLLVRNAQAKEVIRQSEVEGLWVLTAGHIPPDPSELLTSRRFRDFLLSLGEDFDWVVVDSPPALAVTDSSVIAHLVHGIVFVIGSEMTSRRAARSAVGSLERADGRFIGAVLNRVNLHQHPYYYSQYYRREYSDYYVHPATPA